MKKAQMYYDADIKSALLQSIKMDLPALLVGDTGTGKTSFIYDLAEEQGKNDVIRINLTGQTGVDELIGKWLADKNGTYWIDGLLTMAMKKGRWIVLDEINMALPEILSKLHSLLDDDKKIILNEKDGEVVTCHKNFRFFATMNPDEEYAGTKELNKAFISRFPIIAHIDYSPKEADIVEERTGIDFDNAAELVNIAREIRKNKEEEKLSYVCSTRDLIYCGLLIKSGISKELAIKFSILNKAPKEERVPIQKLISLITDIEVTLSDGTKYQSVEEIMEGFKNQEKEFDKIKHINNDLLNDVSLIKTQYNEKITNFRLAEETYKGEIETLRNNKKIPKLKIDGVKIKLEPGDKVQIESKTVGELDYINNYQQSENYGRFGYVDKIEGDPYNNLNDKQNCVIVKKLKYTTGAQNISAYFALSDLNLIEKNK